MNILAMPILFAVQLPGVRYRTAHHMAIVAIFVKRSRDSAGHSVKMIVIDLVVSAGDRIGEHVQVGVYIEVAFMIRAGDRIRNRPAAAANAVVSADRH